MLPSRTFSTPRFPMAGTGRAVALRDGALRLQAARDDADKAALAANVRDGQHVVRQARLVRAVAAAQLLHGRVGGPPPPFR